MFRFQAMPNESVSEFEKRRDREEKTKECQTPNPVDDPSTQTFEDSGDGNRRKA